MHYINMYILVHNIPTCVRERPPSFREIAPLKKRELGQGPVRSRETKILDFRGFDSGRILISRGEIPRPIGNFTESLSQRILVWRFLVWRLAVRGRRGRAGARRYAVRADKSRHRPNGCLAQRVPSLFLASSFGKCSNRAVVKGMFPWRSRHPLS